MKYKVIIIDLDNTLIDFDYMEEMAFKEAILAQNIHYSDPLFQDYKVINQEYWDQLEKGVYDKKTILVKRFEDLFKQYGIKASAEDMNDMYLSNMANHVMMIDGSKELLETLKPHSKLVCLTNGVKRAQDGKLKNSGLGAYFDHVIVSDEVGVNKPDAKIFEAMAEIIQEDNKDTMIIIGDSLTSDIQGGLNYGIKTIWFNPKKKINQTDIKAHYEVHKLEEITPLLV